MIRTHRLPGLIECERLVLRRWRPDDAELLGASVAERPDHVASSLDGKVALRWTVDANDWHDRAAG